MSARGAAGALRAAALALVVALASCSLDYGMGQAARSIGEDIPDTVLFGVSHTIVRDGVPRFRVTADRVETFEKRGARLLHQVTFEELDRDGTVLTEGTADFARYDIRSEDLELTGSLRFYSASRDAWLTSDYLFWDNAERGLTSRPDLPVQVRRGDGTSVVGRGFAAEMSRSIIRFDAGVRGTLVEEE